MTKPYLNKRLGSMMKARIKLKLLPQNFSPKWILLTLFGEL